MISGKLNYITDLCGLRQVTQEEHRAAVQPSRDRVRKSKADLEFDLARDVKGNNKGFYKHRNVQKTTGKNVGLLLSVQGDCDKSHGKSEILCAAFASVFTTKTNL